MAPVPKPTHGISVIMAPYFLKLASQLRQQLTFFTIHHTLLATFNKLCDASLMIGKCLNTCSFIYIHPMKVVMTICNYFMPRKAKTLRLFCVIFVSVTSCKQQREKSIGKVYHTEYRSSNLSFHVAEDTHTRICCREYQWIKSSSTLIYKDIYFVIT